MAATYVYDAWGNHKVLNPDGSENTNPSFIGNINPIRYRSYYYDVETGLYYLHSRYYDPRTGRFISPDSTDYLDPSMISGMNLYAYCGNNPVNRSDLTGTFWDTFVNEISVFWENTKRFFNALGDAVSIDFENDVITINHTLTEVNFKGQTKLNPADRTKNKSSCRTLPLSGSVKIRFIALRAQQEENKKLCGNSYNKEWSDYVFVNEIGDIITPSYMESAFPKLLKKCGLEHRRFHDLRHTCATLMNQQKVPLNHVQAYLGHSDIQTTSNIYTHLSWDDKTGSLHAMEKAVKVPAFDGQKNAWENAKNQETTLIRKRGMEKSEKSLME